MLDRDAQLSTLDSRLLTLTLQQTPRVAVATSCPAAYRARSPRATPLYRLFEKHFEEVRGRWEERFERRYGFGGASSTIRCCATWTAACSRTASPASGVPSVPKSFCWRCSRAPRAATHAPPAGGRRPSCPLSGRAAPSLRPPRPRPRAAAGGEFSARHGSCARRARRNGRQRRRRCLLRTCLRRWDTHSGSSSSRRCCAHTSCIIVSCWAGWPGRPGRSCSS